MPSPESAACPPNGAGRMWPTTKTFHYGTAEILRAHVLAFIAAYNFAKHLKALKWKTPFQTICSAWTANPAVFKINPHHLIPGPYT